MEDNKKAPVTIEETRAELERCYKDLEYIQKICRLSNICNAFAVTINILILIFRILM